MTPARASEHSRQRGLSLIELMIALVIGLIVVAGVMRLLVNSRSAYSTSEAQVHMLEGARFALDQMSRDLRMAGAFGPNSWASTIGGRRGAVDELPAATGDCAAGFYIDLERRLYAIDDSATNPYIGVCIRSEIGAMPGSDMLAVRYADGSAVADADLAENTVYVQSRSTRGQLFVGSDAPTFNPDGNHRLISHLYYVSPHTVTGDGIPALHRLSLAVGAGLVMQDEVLVSGVEGLQLQFGVDDCQFSPCDGDVNRYVDANNALFGGLGWPNIDAVENIRVVRLWLLMRTPGDKHEVGLDTSGSFQMGSFTATFDNDGVRRKLFSTAVNLRNRGRP